MRRTKRKTIDVAEEAEVEEADDAVEEAAVEAAAGPVATAAPAAASSELRIKTKASKKNEREQMMAALDKAAVEVDEQPDFELPPIDLLVKGTTVNTDEQEKDVRKKAKILEKTFPNFGFNVKVVEIETGPVIAQFEVELEAGLRLAKITSLADDIAIALRVPSVRIVAPIPGKNTVGIEVPNAERVRWCACAR